MFEKHLPIIDGNGDYTISILEKLSGDKEEKEPDKKGLTVCIDAGHGGKDNGSDYKNRYEKDDTLAMGTCRTELFAGKRCECHHDTK